MAVLERKLSVAPMLDRTDRFCRYFLRLISRRTLLYTEMVTTGALLHGDPARWLDFDPAEHPLALQLAGSDPAALAASARLGEQWGYDEINLNLGCPSPRVQVGRFGACLMAEPALVAECMTALLDAVRLPVTLKLRLGIDDRDSYGELCDFVGTQAAAGVGIFIVHARKAWLQGLSPKENRAVPPLRYDWVRRLKQDFPALTIVINGGIDTLDQALDLLDGLDGVMIGRAAYSDPWILAEADRRIYGQPTPVPDRRQVLEAYIPFVERQLAQGVGLGWLVRPIMGLFQGVPGARVWRRRLSDGLQQTGDAGDLLRAAAAGTG